MPEEVEKKVKKEPTGLKKIIIQFIKFAGVSVIVSIIQIALVNLLPFLFVNLKTPLGSFLGSIFTEDIVGEGNSTWGYILPYFLSLLIANTFGYIFNKKKTFKSDAPRWHIIIYFIVLLILIFISTWLQGMVVHQLDVVGVPDLLSRTIASLMAGIFLALCLFPLQKYVLLREKKEDKENLEEN